jgi:hypothetical protein
MAALAVLAVVLEVQDRLAPCGWYINEDGYVSTDSEDEHWNHQQEVQWSALRCVCTVTAAVKRR